jgi:hypothetical protein
VYKAAVVAKSAARFTITAATSTGTIELQASVPVHGEVSMEAWTFYKIFVNEYDENMKV